MKKSVSLARRLTIVLTSATAFFWLVAVGLGMLVMFEELEEAFDSALQQTAERLLPLALNDLSYHKSVVELADEIALAPSPGGAYLTYQLKNAAGIVLLHSQDETPEPFPAPLVVGFFDTETHKYYTAASADHAYFIQLSDPLAYREEAAIEGGAALLLPLVALLPLCMIAIRFLIRRILAPIDDLRRQIGEKDGGDMSPVDETSLYRELHPIARSVNLLLERLKSALEAEREFTGNSAHELRTPIAGALAQTQRLLIELQDGKGKERAHQIERSLSHLGHLAEKLLQLSRAEAGIGGAARKIDLVRIVEMVIEETRRASKQEDRIVVHNPDDVTIERAVDADAFAIIVRNLVENALIHSPPGSPIAIHIEKDGVFRFVNDSPIVATDLLTNRFVRGKTTAAGSGLGLSIVQRLVGAIGALDLKSPAAGRKDGFEAVLRL